MTFSGTAPKRSRLQPNNEQNQGELDLIGDPLEMAVDQYIEAIYGNDPPPPVPE
ncbi:hypothetical protein [Oleiphilus messinensis]|nr:hypothetical protein [Oleiphilus messinensis]